MSRMVNFELLVIINCDCTRNVSKMTYAVNYKLQAYTVLVCDGRGDALSGC